MSARYDKRGFTLFEMLAAVAVAMIIAVFVFAFSNSLIQIMRATDSKIGTEVDANVALDIIARDLEAAVFREGRGVMFAVDAQRKSEKLTSWVVGKAPRQEDNDFDPLTHRYGWAGSILRFFTASSAYNAVSYQIIRREGFTDSKRRRYILFRSVVAKEYTEEEGADITVGLYETGRADYLHPGTIRSGNLHGVFLENVVDFGVRLYVYESGHSATDHSPKGLRLIYPATESGLIDSSERSHHAFTGAGTTYSARYPDVIQVYIRVLDRAGAEELLAIEEDGAPGTFEDIVARHGRLYTRTVRIAARGI
jgi:prepilin-type N-terminal cleavage/methylation domain-containing protein